MKKMRLTITPLLVLLVLSGIFLACQAPEGGLTPGAVAPEIPRKELRSTMLGPHLPAFVRVVAHIDVEKQNPLNVKYYYFESLTGGQREPFFEHVVLGHAYLGRNEQGYVILNLTPALQHVLENSRTYLWPLINLGIRVLVEVRSGNFADDQAGIGLGLGTMDFDESAAFITNLQALVNHFGIDGFEFNDIGGGYKAYPPFTRSLRYSLRDAPRYPDEMFEYDDGTPFPEARIERMLWHEGASNFSLLVLNANELLKERHSAAADFNTPPEVDDNIRREISRSIFVRTQAGHGRYLPFETRIVPDAYTGASQFVADNTVAIINDVPHDMTRPTLFLNNEANRHPEIDNHGFPVPIVNQNYAPFVIDLSRDGRVNASNNVAANELGAWFAGTTASPTRYGTLYFINLPARSEIPQAETSTLQLLRWFSMAIFARNVEAVPDGGNHPPPGN